MIKWLIGAIILAAAVIVGLGTYLQPDDLRDCGETPSSAKSCQVVDAIVAVSGGDTNARTDQAISLFKHGWSHTLVFSGAAQDKSGPSNAAAMRLRALRSGVPSSAILLDENSATTKQNAENTQSIFTKNSITSIILVTSGYHQRRASLEFHKMTHDIVIYNHPVAVDKDWSASWWWLTPRGWWLAISEFFKIIAFYVGGTQ